MNGAPNPIASPVSARLAAVQSPIIPIVMDLYRRHPGTISLGQGVVGYGPPPGVADRIARFCETPAHHLYQPDEGTPELRAAIGEKLARENGIDPAGREIMVTAGANMGILNALIAITDPGDEVILPRPYFFNHEMAIRMAGAVPRIVACRPDHQLDLGAIAAAAGPRTRAALLTTSPNNPSGATYPEADLRAVNALCAERGLYHLHDEAYEYFVHDGARHFSPGAIPGSASAHHRVLVAQQGIRVRELAGRVHGVPGRAHGDPAQGAGHEHHLRPRDLAARGPRLPRGGHRLVPPAHRGLRPEPGAAPRRSRRPRRPGGGAARERRVLRLHPGRGRPQTGPSTTWRWCASSSSSTGWRWCRAPRSGWRRGAACGSLTRRWTATRWR